MTDAPNGRIPQPGGFEQVTVAGKTWKFSHINSGIREAFAAWAMQQAYERLERLRPNLPKLDYFRRLKNLDDNVDSGAYDWGFPLDKESCGAAVWKCRNEGEGPGRLAQMLLREFHGEVPVKDITAAFIAAEEQAAAGGHANRMQEAVNRALDPNSASPSQEETGDSMDPKLTASPREVI